MYFNLSKYWCILEWKTIQYWCLLLPMHFFPIFKKEAYKAEISILPTCMPKVGACVCVCIGPGLHWGWGTSGWQTQQFCSGLCREQPCLPDKEVGGLTLNQSQREKDFLGVIEGSFCLADVPAWREGRSYPIHFELRCLFLWKCFQYIWNFSKLRKL